MHELALCQAIVDTVGRHADGRRVERVDVRIGHFRQVVPDSLQFSWELLTEGTDLAGCRLVVDHVPAVVECRACGAATTPGRSDPGLLVLREQRRDAGQRRGAPGGLHRPRPRGVLMGRFHRHPDGTVHEHEHETHDHDDHDHDGDDGQHRDVGDHTGYADTGAERVAVLESILDENDRVADRNRADFARAGVTTVNLMSSPGAGKTTLLKPTIAALGERIRLGDPGGRHRHQPRRRRADGLGAPVSLVNTSAGFGGECHLDATMVRSGLGRLPLDQLDLLLIENVGNLVCPAEFDVGQHARAMVYALTEGEEKPLKYPVMFHACRRRGGQQDRPPPAPRRRPRSLRRQRARRQPDRPAHPPQRPDRRGPGRLVRLAARGAARRLSRAPPLDRPNASGA